MSRMKIAIVGAGGFAREVAATWDINAVPLTYDLAGYLVSDLEHLNDTDSRDKVLGDFEGCIPIRRRLMGWRLGLYLQVKLGSPKCSRGVPRPLLALLVHPSMRFDQETAEIEHGVVLCAGSIATVNITFVDSRWSISCTIGHESVIGAGAVLNPTVNISGGPIAWGLGHASRSCNTLKLEITPQLGQAQW
ncbi:MAG: hypothetical protein IPN91_12840 [Holophagaceae bacterium]|uniref:PglD N-terminal domain-containing protein n=1 Tax=Candidatus Geothrix odensensis TaxID=2954440 RepID=A0A936F4C2_9BACT|nr:hypothetical protein [Candidatus Geothrix odensensis]